MYMCVCIYIYVECWGGNLSNAGETTACEPALRNPGPRPDKRPDEHHKDYLADHRSRPSLLPSEHRLGHRNGQIRQ